MGFFCNKLLILYVIGIVYSITVLCKENRQEGETMAQDKTPTSKHLTVVAGYMETLSLKNLLQPSTETTKQLSQAGPTT